uniref:IgGFc-binding protein N-terminal domain-containing protein n=1 Tax=Magallana gigas TaxID=29159 RepID=A0A8W8P023_MAGGI|nr:uncharacterized protein LOC105340230 [Crassostrea gigas]
MGNGTILKIKSQADVFYDIPTKKASTSKNFKYIIKSDTVPEIKKSNKRRWLMILTLGLLLISAAALIATLLYQLKLNEIDKIPYPDPDLQIPTTAEPIAGQNVTIGSRGKGFIVLFTKSIIQSTNNVYITSENGVQMNMSTSPDLDASIKSQIDRSVNIPSSQHIILPSELELQSFRKEVKSVLIETSSDVFVISHDDGAASVGSTTHIPLHKLSNKYVVVSTEPESTWPSQFAVTAIDDNTTISIIFKMKRNLPLNIEGNTFYNGDVFNFSLDRFQTYQIEHMTDLSGTFIESSVPIAAFSGNDCNLLEGIGACDHLIEQLPPTDSVDVTYIVPPNMNDRDTLIRITAIENANITYMIGSVTRALSLYKFDSFDTKISSSQTCFIKSDTPILVTAFGLPSTSSTLGDPSMTIVPGLNQYLDYYKIVVPAGYDHNYVSIMIESSEKESLRINGALINTGDIVFEEGVSAGNDTYNVRSICVPEGELTASTVNGQRFGLMFAGITDYEAYGFSGNSMLL